MARNILQPIEPVDYDGDALNILCKAMALVEEGSYVFMDVDSIRKELFKYDSHSPPPFKLNGKECGGSIQHHLGKGNNVSWAGRIMIFYNNEDPRIQYNLSDLMAMLKTEQ